MIEHPARTIAAFVFALLIVAPGSAQTLDDARLRVETYASGFEDLPTAFTFAGKDEMFVFERRTGRVVRLQNGQITGIVLDLNVADENSRGGIGIVADPNYSINHFIYVYYSAAYGSDGGPWMDNRVVRFTFDGYRLVEAFGPLLIFPYDPAQENAPQHNSGVLRFGPDGKLYGLVGDFNRGRFAKPAIEQNTSTSLSSGAGAIYRINPDGTVPGDNPFASHADPEVRRWFIYGFRNSFGFTFDRLTSNIWFTDNGPDNYDEVNRGRPGMNAGWLKICGPDARDYLCVENGFTAYDESDLVFLPGSTYGDPELSFFTCIGITSVCFLHSKRFPEDLQDDCMVADSSTGQLYHLPMAPDRLHFVLSGGLTDRVADNDAERTSLRIGHDLGVLTDVQVGPDGYLYLTAYTEGKIRRIRPVADLVEPQSIVVRRGEIDSGGLEEVERSDDRVLMLSGDSDNAAARDVIFVMTVNQADPKRLDLVVEGHATKAGIVQQLLIYHVPTGTWHVLDERTVLPKDEVITIPDIANPTAYIDPLKRRIQVRILQWDGDPATAVSPPSSLRAQPPAGFRTVLDQVQLLVEYP